MYKKCINLVKLMRINQPIGFFLLLWPTLWGLWIANNGTPSISIIILFITGVLCMRSAGCVINDYIDYNIDSHIHRTKHRPLVNGTVKKKEALTIILVLTIISSGLIIILNITTIFLSIIAFILSIIYPFLKRYTYLPQLVLGIIFSFPILITSAAVHHPINSTIWLLFIANIIWTISYDTQYAMLDRDDDRKIAVKSTALLFGDLDKIMIGILQFIMILIFILISRIEQWPKLFDLFSILGSIIIFIWQHILIYNRSQKGCLKAFLSNNYIGLLIFIGIYLNFS